jgi:hypothetical protein
MFTQLAARQSEVVAAFMDSVEPELSWRKAFIHAEFRADDPDAPSLTEMFLVLARPDPARPHWLPLEFPVLAALERLYRDYLAAGQGFTRLDLTIAAPDGEYRFEFSRVPSPRLDGQPDPDAERRLLRRYAALLAER